MFAICVQPSRVAGWPIGREWGWVVKNFQSVRQPLTQRPGPARQDRHVSREPRSEAPARTRESSLPWTWHGDCFTPSDLSRFDLAPKRKEPTVPVER
jgi:hypothetical protein